MAPRRDLGWWFWLLNALALAVWLFGCEPLGLAGALAAAVFQLLYFLYRHRSAVAFPVQVRIGYLLLLAAGALEPLRFVHWIQLAGTIALLTLDYCPLVRLLSLLPWNRRGALSLALVKAVVLTPPSAWPQLREALRMGRQ